MRYVITAKDWRRIEGEELKKNMESGQMRLRKKKAGWAWGLEMGYGLYRNTCIAPNCNFAWTPIRVLFF